MCDSETFKDLVFCISSGLFRVAAHHKAPPSFIILSWGVFGSEACFFLAFKFLYSPHITFIASSSSVFGLVLMKNIIPTAVQVNMAYS